NLNPKNKNKSSASNIDLASGAAGLATATALGTAGVLGAAAVVGGVAAYKKIKQEINKSGEDLGVEQDNAQAIINKDKIKDDAKEVGYINGRMIHQLRGQGIDRITELLNVRTVEWKCDICKDEKLTYYRNNSLETEFIETLIHTVSKDDQESSSNNFSLDKIAQKYKIEIKDLEKWNPSFETHFKELYDSIKSNGVLKPLIAMEKPNNSGSMQDRFEIIDGSIRYQIVKKLGKSKIPVIRADANIKEFLNDLKKLITKINNEILL
ncbi:ParB N-terminal domain-containing protein, partial [bacterium]|nr:ParB N-terminal domain-containing protein [bacterium]